MRNHYRKLMVYKYKPKFQLLLKKTKILKPAGIKTEPLPTDQLLQYRLRACCYKLMEVIAATIKSTGKAISGKQHYLQSLH